MAGSGVLTATKTAASIIFSDTNLDVNDESSYALVFNEDAINKSIITILGTRIGTRPFRRDFGSTLLDLIFNPMDEITAGSIRTALIEAIDRWEPRIKMVKSEVIPNYEIQSYYVYLEYTIPALANKSAVFTFNISARGG